MVLCLVTLTDLQMRRAGLSASAEFLVLYRLNVYEMRHAYILVCHTIGL